MSDDLAKAEEIEQKLFEISHITGFGSVEGVEIDLRHADLPLQDWRVRALADSRFKFRDENEPFIWFPWFGKFDKKFIEDEYLDDARYSKEKLNKRLLAEWVLSETPECYIFPGDRLEIEEVEIVDLGDGYCHPHDREERYATLRIRRSNGRYKKVPTQMRFYGRSSILNPAMKNGEVFSLLDRVMKYFSLEHPDEFDGARASPFDLEAQIAVVAARDLWKLLEPLRSQTVTVNDPRLQPINRAAYLGYLWSQIETAKALRPAAQAMERLRIAGAVGGTRSGQVRRERAEATWMAHASQLAKDIRRERPAASQDDVASEIQQRWKSFEFSHPGHKSLKNFVARLEKSGEILPRQA